MEIKTAASCTVTKECESLGIKVELRNVDGVNYWSFSNNSWGFATYCQRMSSLSDEQVKELVRLVEVLRDPCK